jgi:hypothetical protein
VKLPVPLPSVVLLSDTVGYGEVLQHTPRAVTVAPPSSVIVPPDCADSWVTFETAVVVTVGRAGAGVVKDFSFPYSVPASVFT